MLHTHIFMCHQRCIIVATDSFAKNNSCSEREGLFINGGNKIFVLGTVNLNGRDETSQLCFNRKTIPFEMGIKSLSETCILCSA